MKNLVLAVVSTLLIAPAHAQKIISPHASLTDVPALQATLRATTNPLLLNAAHRLRSCNAIPPVVAPTGRIDIPHHYLTGSSGPTNPAEAEATRVYGAFESRVTAGMNQYVATGSHAESACALAQLDMWAKAGALLDYDAKESTQAWFQVEWTLSSAGIADSVLVNDATLDVAQQTRVTAWLDAAARKDISFEKPNDTGNNHHYWRALAATAIGITASDDKLFHFGIDTYKEAISEIDSNGAFPKEMARHENATHYQGFALEPLALIAQFASRQGADLYLFQSHGRSIRDAIVFFSRAATDPSLIKPYTSDAQKPMDNPNDFAAFTFYVQRFGTDELPSNLIDAIQHPQTDTRLGGSTTLLAASPYHSNP
jgi:poly(beta-D-mannuronate) lyase